MIPKFAAKCIKGKLRVLDEEQFEQYLRRLPENVLVVVKDAKEREIRSSNQNRYLWGVVYKLLSDETGYELDDVHELMKLRFNYKMLHIAGEEVRVPQSTAILNTIQMEEYLKNIRQWASKQLSIFIPTPNEVQYE